MLAGPVLLLSACEPRPNVMPSMEPPGPAPSQPLPQQHPKPPMPPVVSAGPLTQAGVEVYMDAQEADLRSYLRGQGVPVARRGNEIVLTVLTDRLFAGQALSDWGDSFARAVAQVTAHFDRTALDIACYTDAKGAEADNLALSQKRAKSLADAFRGYGIAGSRLKAEGLGATNPRGTDPNAARNRRIEIRISPRPSN
ncbi:hypothetical protein GCM10008941_25760 [Rhizomicrobium palustre]